MSSSPRRVVLAILPFLVLAAVAVVLAGVLSGDRDEADDVELLPVNPGGPVGLADLRQDGDRLRGRLVVWGLGPGSRHLAEVRGPGGACRPQRRQVARRALVLPELVADPNGVAFARIDARAPGDVVGRGYYLMVYSSPASAAGNARVACGNLMGGGRLRPADLASVGPGAGARARISTIIQLRDGRPIGGTQQVSVSAGERVALAVRSDLPDEVAIDGLGLTQQVGPGTIARLSLVPRRAGRFPLRARTAGPRPVATLVVRRGSPARAQR